MAMTNNTMFSDQFLLKEAVILKWIQAMPLPWTRTESLGNNEAICKAFLRLQRSHFD